MYKYKYDKNIYTYADMYVYGKRILFYITSINNFCSLDDKCLTQFCRLLFFYLCFYHCRGIQFKKKKYFKDYAIVTI